VFKNDASVNSSKVPQIHWKEVLKTTFIVLRNNKQIFLQLFLGFAKDIFKGFL